MNPAVVKIYDKDNNLVDQVELPPRRPDQGKRRLVWHGKRFIEGGGDNSFYGVNEFAEVVETQKEN